jgi:indolepyruvate ferredoxin oxidoreductase beta subunit
MVAARLSDYQDDAYAGLFLDRIERVAAIDTSASNDAKLTAATARSLGLWMSFEDVMRVAQLKTRRGRAERIRREVKASPKDLVEVREFVKPRAEEICGTLPAGLGRRLLASGRAHRMLTRFTAGRRISTTSISGFALLRGIAALRRFRRGSLRYQIENQRIEAWLIEIAEIAPRNHDLAVELAECQTLVKGYGDTHERGWRNFSILLGQVAALQHHPEGAAVFARLQQAALADEEGTALGREMEILCPVITPGPAIPPQQKTNPAGSAPTGSPVAAKTHPTI